MIRLNSSFHVSYLLNPTKNQQPETNNPHSYIVATQDTSLRTTLRNIPGVPLIYLKMNNLILEPISEASKAASAQVDLSLQLFCLPCLEN